MQLGVPLLWATASGFLSGVFVRSLVALSDTILIFLCISAFCVLIFSVRDPRRLMYGASLAAFLVFFGAGVIRMESGVLQSDPLLNSQIGTRVTLEGMVADEPDIRAQQVRVSIRTDSATVLAVLPAYTDIGYGEHVRVEGTLKIPESFETDEGRRFNYPGYLATKGIAYQLDRAWVLERGAFEGSRLIAGAFDIKHVFVSGLSFSLPEPHAALAGGITVGEKRGLGEELTQEFQDVSLIHIIVLSGYNITIVVAGFAWMLSTSSPRVRFAVAGVIVLFFAVMTGFASASLRAALMALIAMTGSYSGRIYRADRALILVGAGMVAWNPYLLTFDPGFQLSFLATAGLILFSPILISRLHTVPETFGLREILASTLSAQLAVLPLLLYSSGNLSLVAIPANLAVLVAVPGAMLASLCAAITGLIGGVFAPLLAFPAYALLSYILAVSHAFASIPYAAVPIPAFSVWMLIPTYAALFFWGIWNFCTQKNTAPLRGREETY